MTQEAMFLSEEQRQHRRTCLAKTAWKKLYNLFGDTAKRSTRFVGIQKLLKKLSVFPTLHTSDNR